LAFPNYKRFMILNKENWIYLSLLGVLLVGTVFLLSMTVTDVMAQKEAIQKDVARISEDYLQQPSLEEVTRNIDSREKEVLDFSEKFFVKTEDEFEFVKFLENLGGGEIDQKIKFSLSKKIEEGGYIKVPLEITAESDFPKILGYIGKLEKIDYFFGINSVNIMNLKPLGTETSRVQATISGFVYWL